MNGKQFREKLHAGERLYGTLIVSDSPRWPPVVSGLGLDFVFLDTEHVARDREKVSWLCQAYAAYGLPPVVRLPSPDPYQATAVLDGGARGIIAPYVESAEEVRRMVGAVKFRPLKGKKLRAALAGEAPLEPELADYLAGYNEQNSLIINIESVPALAALDEILAVPGLDGVLVGPHDLTTSLGVPEQYFHPAYVEAVDTIICKCRARQIGVGVHVMYSGGVAQEARWAQMGANLLVHGSDLRAFRYGLQPELDQLKKALGDGPAEDGEPEEAI